MYSLLGDFNQRKVNELIEIGNLNSVLEYTQIGSRSLNNSKLSCTDLMGSAPDPGFSWITNIIPVCNMKIVTIREDTDTLSVSESVVCLFSILGIAPLVSNPFVSCHISNGPVVLSEEPNHLIKSYSLAFV
jgi:hypothetical protein